jgi:2-C-methyl-D-erythritol 4-phosphate cytidylyltransferase/2-C-methyl-D-erythritol 2,4-cyclodiphosphate synthase
LPFAVDRTKPTQVRTAAIILAAGSGTRAGGEIPKQYQSVGGKPLLRHALECFASHPEIDFVLPVIAAGDEDRFRSLSTGLSVGRPALGGETRQQSGLSGLERLSAEKIDHVLIHDAARPFVSGALISRVIGALGESEGVIPALPVSETLKRAPAGRVEATVDRSGLWGAQTPQGFRYQAILSAHRRAAEAGRSEFTDDAAVAEWAGMSVSVVPGEIGNRKITSADDLREADRKVSLGEFMRCLDVRTGQGFDVHAFEAGDRVILGGVRIPHTARLKGHSDADAVLHAVTDAVLGAIGEADIGKHFPPTDERWRGASSSIFLAHAMKLLADRGGFIANADVTVVCEEPRISPHADAMRTSLAAMLGVDVGRVSVKATTSERMGFTGRGEGLAAFATVTVRLP